MVTHLVPPRWLPQVSRNILENKQDPFSPILLTWGSVALVADYGS